jgi:tRNA pseudouridine13 synthase
MTLADLAVPGTPEIHFEPEERPLVSFPGRLAVGEARDDELNEGRLRVNVAFTLEPGAYATLVVKRLFQWTLEPRRDAEGRGRRRAPRPELPPRSAPEGAPAPPPKEGAPAVPEPRLGFLARKRAEKEARKARREAARKGT